MSWWTATVIVLLRVVALEALATTIYLFAKFGDANGMAPTGISLIRFAIALGLAEVVSLAAEGRERLYQELTEVRKRLLEIAASQDMPDADRQAYLEKKYKHERGEPA